MSGSGWDLDDHMATLKGMLVSTNLDLPRCQVSQIWNILVMGDDIPTSNAPGVSLFQVGVPKAHADPYMKCAWP